MINQKFICLNLEAYSNSDKSLCSIKKEARIKKLHFWYYMSNISVSIVITSVWWNHLRTLLCNFRISKNNNAIENFMLYINEQWFRRYLPEDNQSIEYSSKAMHNILWNFIVDLSIQDLRIQSMISLNEWKQFIIIFIIIS